MQSRAVAVVQQIQLHIAVAWKIAIYSRFRCPHLMWVVCEECESIDKFTSVLSMPLGWFSHCIMDLCQGTIFGQKRTKTKEWNEKKTKRQKKLVWTWKMNRNINRQRGIFIVFRVLLSFRLFLVRRVFHTVMLLLWFYYKIIWILLGDRQFVAFLCVTIG